MEPYAYETVPERLAHFASLHPEKYAFIDINEQGERKSTATFAELHDKTVKFAKGLMELGLTKGDVVGIALPNSVEWLCSMFGTMMAGGIPLHFNFLRRDGDVINKIISRSEKCKCLIIDTGNKDQHVQVCENLFGKIYDKGEIKSDHFPLLMRIIFINTPSTLKNPMLFDDLIEIGTLSKQNKFPTIFPDDIAFHCTSSGTTGVPKIVPKTHIYLLRAGYDVFKMLDMDANNTYFNALPFGWGASFPVCLLHAGITRISCDMSVINSAEDQVGFLWKILEKERCTTAFLYPKVLIELGRSSMKNAWKLHSVWTVGVPAPSNCSKITPRLSKKFINAYGSTELGKASYVCVEQPSQYKDFDVGCPVEGVEMKIVDDKGNVVPVNAIGELYIRKNLGFHGYLNNPIATQSMVTNNGWFKTNDIGYMSETGHYFITGRKSDLFKVANNFNTETVSPSVIEAKIQAIPGIEAVCVLPYENDDELTEVCACIEVMKGWTINKADIIHILESDFVDEARENPILPQKYIFLDKIERNLIGKVFRTKMTEKISLLK